jgi:hypothetical protein
VLKRRGFCKKSAGEREKKRRVVEEGGCEEADKPDS